MAHLVEIIPASAFERVRDRIAEIIADEFENQVTLMGETGSEVDADIWVERSIPFSHTELPSINVLLARGNYGQGGGDNAITSDGVYSYMIDVVVGSKAKLIEGAKVQGDQLASIKLQKMVGMIRAIIKNPYYKTLAFASPFISKTSIENILFSEPININDTLNVMTGRITFSVRVAEGYEIATPSNIAGYDTTVKLYLTDKGYVFSGDGVPEPEPQYGGEVFLNDVSFGIVETGDSLNIVVVDAENNPVGEKISDVWVVPVGGISEIQLTINDDEFETLTESPSNVVVENTNGVEVGSKVGNNWQVPNGTVTVKNSANTTIDTTQVVSGGVVEVVITDSTAVVKNSAGTTIATESIPAEVSENIVIADTTATAKNSANTTIGTATQVAGVATTVTIADITKTDSDGTTSSVPAGVDVVCTPQVKSLTAYFNIHAVSTTSDLITVSAANLLAGTYTSTANDGASGTITFSINGGAYAAFVNPTTLVNGDTIRVQRTITTADGYVTLTGTYV